MPQLPRIAVLLTTVALLVTGCSDDSNDVAATTTTSTSTPSLSGPSTTTTSALPGEGQSVVVLEAGGLGVLPDPSGSHVDQLTFGRADLAATTAALTSALGEVVETHDLTECGEGPLHAVTVPGLVTYFADGKLSGWAISRVESPVLTTASGIGVGSSLADLKDAYDPVTVDQTSLGTEWYTGQEGQPSLQGTLTNGTPSATIDNLWSGTTCVAR